ncbi:MAG: uracil-DNA glycosylase [Bacteroidetes bacterium]|jgi:uracil-DNA glycosylase|nr:uracil-DNA glycosylase [Bacteroidota bacterium]
MSLADTVQLAADWKQVLAPALEAPSFRQLVQFLKAEKAAGKTLYPPGPLIFNAFAHTPYRQVKAVILGQDPYHGPGQAHGLCFSVPPGVPIPPSLANIYKELQADLGQAPPPHGNLERWARQGILLLNATLTVQAEQAGSHQHRGWEPFTDAVIQALNERPGPPIVFLLWGSYAQKKGQIINRNRHQVLQAPHPSPLSAHRGFLGCRHFSQANAHLLASGQAPIDWTP